MNKVILSPSIMCADLLNLKESVRQLEKSGVDALHIDIIDGQFSPSMPLGIDTVKKLRSITELPFDVHIMSVNNPWFVNEMLDIGVQQISFHHETTLHADRLINVIKRRGVRAGIALNPATSLSVLDSILPQVDCLLLMLINPGFAGDSSETQVSYAKEKVAHAAEIIHRRGLQTDIQVDGRVSLKLIPQLVGAGASNLVLGSTSLYQAGNTFEQNLQLLDESIQAGLSLRNQFAKEEV